MATAAMTSTSPTSSAISSSTNNSLSAPGTGSASSSSKLFYGSLPSTPLPSGLSAAPSSVRSRRGKQGPWMLSCSGPSHYALASGSSNMGHSSNALSRINSGSRKDSSAGVSLFKLRGLKWKALYENIGFLTELNSSDSDDDDRQRRRSKASVMRLNKSDMGLYGLCPEIDPFCAAICSICNAVVKPQGIQKHMFNRHNAHSSHHTCHYSSSSHQHRQSVSENFERSNEYYSPSHSAVSSTLTNALAVNTSGGSASSIAASCSFASGSTSSSVSSTNNLHSASGSGSSSSRLYSVSSGYGSLPSTPLSSGLSATPSSIRSRRGKQGPWMLSCSGTSHYSLASGSSNMCHTSNTLSRISSGRRKDSVGVSLLKLTGLKWNAFYENSGFLAELNSSDSDDDDRHRRRNKANVMRLNKSDMGLYGLCPETDPFYAAICSICNAVIKPQGLEKHMFNRHSSHSSHHRSHHSSSTQHSSISRQSGLGSFVRSNEYYSPSTSTSSSITATNVLAGITPGASNSSIAASCSFTSGSSNSSSLRSKSKSTSNKIKSKSGKSSSNQISSSSVSSTWSSSSASLSPSLQRYHNPSNSTSSGSSTSSITGAGNSTSQVTATNPATHAISSAARANHLSAQKTDSNSKQIKPLTGTACLSTSSASQHLQPHGGSPSKGMIAPTHSEASISIPECSMSGSAVTSSNSNSSISSSSSSTSASTSSKSSSSSSRRTYGQNIRGRSSERKNFPVKDREYDADRHCGALTGDPPKPCTHSLTCKTHSLSMRRIVNGRTKSFDKLLSEHRMSKEHSSSRIPHNSVTRAIPEFESSNSSSSIEMDRRSLHSVSSNSNLSTEAQPHSSSASMSPTSLIASNIAAQTASALVATAAVTDALSIIASASATISSQNHQITAATLTSGNNVLHYTSRSILSNQPDETNNESSVDIQESVETVRTSSGRIQLNLSRDDVPSTGQNFNRASNPGNNNTNRHHSLPAAEGENNGVPRNYKVTTRLIDAVRSAIPAELLDDKNFESNVFSAESMVLKRPITLLADEDEEEFKRARTIDNDIDLMDISKERKLQLKIQHRVQTKNKYRFRAPGEPSEYALSMPPAAEAVAKLFVASNPNATVTNAKFVLDPETNTVSVSMNGTFDPNDLRVNWKSLDKKFLEQTILESLKPHGVTVNENGHLVIPARKFIIPNPEDEGFLIHHHKQMTEEEYANLRPEFINGMPKPVTVIIPVVKGEFKNEHDPIATSHLPPILPDLHKELRNMKMEIKQEIKEEPMNEDEILEYCQPADYLEGSQTYGDIHPEVSSIDPSSFEVPSVNNQPANGGFSQIEIPSNQQLPQAETPQFSDNTSPTLMNVPTNEALPSDFTPMDITSNLENTNEPTNSTNAFTIDGPTNIASSIELSNIKVTANEISFSIPFVEISPEEISNAISALNAAEGSQVQEISQNIEEFHPDEQMIQMQDVSTIEPTVPHSPSPIPPPAPPLSPPPPPPPPPPPTFPPTTSVEDVVEMMSIMAESDDENLDDSDLGLVDAISNSNSKIYCGDQLFSSHQEKENTKVLIDENFYDISPFGDDVIRGLKTWHNSIPKPLRVNMFGLGKFRGVTAFQKQLVNMRKSNLSIKNYRSNSSKQFIIVSATGTIPIKKRSIIMHKGQINKTCKVLRSNIVSKLSEQLLGYKKIANSARNINTSGNNNVSQFHGSFNNTGRSTLSSESTAANNASTNRTFHLNGGSNKGKYSRSGGNLNNINNSNNSNNSNNNNNNNNGSSASSSSNLSNSFFVGVQSSLNNNNNSSIQYSNMNGAPYNSSNQSRLSSSSKTKHSSSSSLSGSSRSSLGNQHRNGTDYN